MATNAMHAIVRQLEGPIVVALLVNRASWVTGLLEYGLAWPEHVPVAELTAVRDALRFASAQCGIEVVELDEKSLADLATQVLGMPLTQIDVRLKALGAPQGRPWRKEQKLACLSAWLALQRHAGA